MRLISTLFFILLLALAACGGSQPAPTAQNTEAQTAAQPQAADTETVIGADTQAEDTQAAAAQPATAQPAAEQPEAAQNNPAADAGSAYSAPAWTQIALTNARTGESFTLADFAGKTVYVHMMATWCTNCRASQRSLNSGVIPQVSSDDFVFVSIDVQTQLTAGELASYADNNGFGWTFAVATPDFLRAVSNELGTSIANPPSTPHFYISPIGTVSALQTGSPSPEQKLDELRNFANS